MALKRQLSLIELTLMGVGMILGAGIYVLIGSAGEATGPSLWLAFFTAGVISMLTGLSYAELASMRPEAGSSFNYVLHAFKSKRLAFLAGWIFSAAAVSAAATVAQGFARYVNSMGVSSDLFVSSVFIISVGVALNIRGLSTASKANSAATVLEMLGLLIVIAVGFLFAPSLSLSTQMTGGTAGFMSALALAFFAFIGFEVIANQAGEAKNPGRTVPLALLLAISISMLLYCLTALAFTSLVPHEKIVEFNSQKVGALAAAASEAAGPGLLLVLAVIALFSTGNTVLLSVTAASRMIYGMARSSALPKIFARTRQSVPLNAVLFSGVAAFALLFAGGLELVATATVLGMLFVFALDNAAVVKLRASDPKAKRPFAVPLSVGGIPLLPALGCLSCLALLAYTAYANPGALAVLAGFSLVGLALAEIELRS